MSESKPVVVEYKELVFQPITGVDLWHGPWHREDGWGVVLTLACGHQKAVSRSATPKRFAHCVLCTLHRKGIRRKGKVA